ncbi:MAG: hypothetical protein FJX57_12590, partial [Alphaproteobacteria bacterium]|nr:hypothetical protein [Alphaproteobacteria bacterium]
MNIGEVLNGVFDDDLGWHPASGAIKPVHVANGVVRAIQGRHYDLQVLNHFAIPWKRKGQSLDEERSFEALSKDHADQLGYLARNREQFEKTRNYVLGLVNADRAVFPSAEHSSFSLTNGLLATRDHNDRGLGEFGAFMLGEGPDSLRDAVAAATQVQRPSDPITAVLWPLLVDRVGRETRQGEDPRSERFARVSRQKHNRAIFEALREAGASLASHERGHGNGLKTLQRSVHFACIATFAHAQAAASNGALEQRVPGLVAIAGQRRSDVALASENSVESIFLAFEHWLGERLANRIASGQSLLGGKKMTDGEPSFALDALDGRTVKALLRKIALAGRGHGEPGADDIDVRYQKFVATRTELGDDNTARVLGHTLARCYFHEFDSGGPREFLQ